MQKKSNIVEHELLAKIEAFCAVHGMGPSAFSLRAVGDPTFVKTLRNGREVRRRTRARVEAFMDQHNGATAA
jgi:hypothetical protein